MFVFFFILIHVYFEESVNYSRIVYVGSCFDVKFRTRRDKKKIDYKTNDGTVRLDRIYFILFFFFFQHTSPSIKGVRA